MRVNNKSLALGALVAFFASALAQADDGVVQLVSDPYPPYVMDQPDGKGFVTDMAIAVFKAAGHEAVYVNVPYQRALSGMKNGDFQGLLAVSPGREHYIYHDDEFGVFETQFYVKKDSDWTWAGLESLRNMSLGVIDGYGYDDDALNEYIKTNKDNPGLVQPNFGSDALGKNLKKLKAGRINVIVADAGVFWHTANKLGLTDEFKAAGRLSEPSPIKVGFYGNKSDGEKWARVLSEGLPAFRKTEKYDEIKAQYGIQ